MKNWSLVVTAFVLIVIVGDVPPGRSGTAPADTTAAHPAAVAVATATPPPATATSPADSAATPHQPAAALRPAGKPGAGGAAAPNFKLPTANGTISLESLRGKVVLVDFWASWCDPCKKSFPWMKSLYQSYAAKGFRIVAVNLDKKQELADDFLEKYESPFIVAFDPSGKTAEAWKVAAMPTSYLIGPTGAILYTHAGFDQKGAGVLESLVRQECTSQ